MFEVLTLNLAAARIAVVGVNYAPEPTGSAPYTAGMAEMLAAQARSVDVVCGIPHYPSWRVDPAYRWRLRHSERLRGVEVHHLRHYVPRQQDALRRLLWEGTFLAHAGIYRLPHAPDLVIASTPGLASGVVGAALAARYRVPFGVVVQDLVGQGVRQSGLAGGGSVAGLVARVEGAVLRRADSVAVVSDTFRTQLAEYGIADSQVQVLANWTHIVPRQQGDAATRQRLGWNDGRFVVLHTGNMGLKQDLGNVIAAARRSGPDKHFVLLGDGSQRAALERQAAGLGNLSFLDPVDSARYPDVLAAADLLLVNERPTVGDMSLPSKLTSYLAAGGPILAAVGNGGACAAELARTGGAAVVVAAGDPAALARAVERLAAAPGDLLQMGERGRNFARQTLNADAARQRYLSFAEGLLDAGAHTRTVLAGRAA
ncbi:MAG: glycosyltransferase family 4 protein [Frankiaceae bacterium]